MGVIWGPMGVGAIVAIVYRSRRDGCRLRESDSGLETAGGVVALVADSGAPRGLDVRVFDQLGLDQLGEHLEAAHLDVRARLARDKRDRVPTVPLDEVACPEALVGTRDVPHALRSPIALTAKTGGVRADPLMGFVNGVCRTEVRGAITRNSHGQQTCSAPMPPVGTGWSDFWSRTSKETS